MAIDKFEGDYRWLSNFWPSPVTLDGVEYSTVEHAYQAAKSLDPTYRTKIANAITPTKAKTLGKKANLRPDWDVIKIPIMSDLIRQKFEYPMLRASLKATCKIDLIEGNWWGDTFWGVYRGKGTNYLCKILMTERAKWL